MLLIRCAACRRKLWKYRKIGPGEVLRCHKDRIERTYEFRERPPAVLCPCGKRVGIDMGSFIKMIGGTFTCTGTKNSG